MGVDEEYKMVAGDDEASDHLLERAGAISRSSYRKRNMFASILVGAVIGAAATFLISLIFSPSGFSITKSADHAPEKQLQQAPVVVTTTATHISVQTQTRTVQVSATGAVVNTGSVVSGKKHQDGVDQDHLIESGVILDCGHNPEEARSKGCVFDVMMQDWMPKPCYDQTLSERYLLNGNWSWWANAEATEFLSLEQMRKGEHDVIYVIQDYHKSHCIFAWEKMVRAVRNDWPLIEELISYDHVMHCRHSTLSKEAEGIRGVRAPTAFVRCALVEDWSGHFPANSVSSVDKRWAVQRDTEKRWEVVDMPNARH